MNILKKFLLSVAIIMTLVTVLWIAGFFILQESAPVPRVTSTEAIKKVKNLPDVQEWLSLFSGPGHTSPITGGKPIIEIDSISDDSYIIHAYEQTSDHTATFGWYSVNKKTGAISKEF